MASPPAPPIRTQLNLPRETFEALKQLAAKTNTTVAELVRAAISTDRLLREAVERGDKVLIMDKKHSFREVVIPQ